MQCACTTLPTVPCPDKPYFSTLSHKQHDFRKKRFTEHQKVCFGVCTIFPEIYLIISHYNSYLIISHFISLYLIISQHISLYLIISHYNSYLIISYYISLYLIISQHISLYLERTDNTTLPKHALNYKPRGEEIVDAPGKDDNASMPEQIKRPNAWRKMMMVMTMVYHILRSTERYVIKNVCVSLYKVSDILLRL